MKRVLWIVLGCIGVGLGAVGAVLPLLPAFPFLLLAAFSFAKSSERLHTWFVNTKLYQNNLESYVTHRAMTMRTKRRVMATVTLLMAFGFTLMFLKGLYLPLRDSGRGVGVPHPVLPLRRQNPGGPSGLIPVERRHGA